MNVCHAGTIPERGDSQQILGLPCPRPFSFFGVPHTVAFTYFHPLVTFNAYINPDLGSSRAFAAAPVTGPLK